MGDADGDGQFIGRNDELTRLRVALERAAAGRGGAVVVGGEAGIGKTYLVERFAADARIAGAEVLTGACIEFGGRGIPFAPFVEALRGLLRTVEPGRVPATFGPGRHGLARLLPELERAALETSVDAEIDRSGQARLFELVLELVERLGRSRPVVLIVEDVQWADDDTRDLISFLIRHLRSGPTLTVITVRTDDLDYAERVQPYLAELERDDWVSRLDLRSFDRHEVARLLTIGTGRVPPADILDDILSRSGGNPFYAEQLMAVILAGDDDRHPLPQRLRDVLEARLSSLPGTVLDVVRAAAAAGHGNDEAMLAAGLALDNRALTAALRVAVERAVLVPVGDSNDGSGRYLFRHPLLEEVAYSQLLPGERTRLHGLYAAYLATARTDDPGITASELAFHLDGAGQYREAVPVLIEAGGVAERAYAFGQAGRLYERALELGDRAGMPDVGVDGDRVRVMHRAAECALLSGAPQRAIHLGRQAITILEAAVDADDSRLVTLRERLRWYLWESGDRAAAEVSVTEALDRIPIQPVSVARARALAQAAGLKMEAGALSEAVPLAYEAIAIARALHAPAEEAFAGGILGWCQAVSGDVDLGTKTYRHALVIAEGLGGAEGVALGHAKLAALLDRVGRTDASLTVALEGYAVVRRLGVSRTYGGTLLGHAAKALFDLGRWPEAAATADEGLDLDPVGRAAIQLHLARARIDANTGRSSDAAAHLARARLLADRPGLLGAYGPSLLAAEADLARRGGEYDRVRASVDEAITFVADDRSLDPALGWLAETALGAEADAAASARARHDQPALAEAVARSQRILAIVRRASEMPAFTVDARRDALLALCEAEAQRTTATTDGSDWSVAAERWEALHRPHRVAYARFRQGEASLRARGDRTAAGAVLRQAHEAALALDANPLREAIERLAQHARIDLDRPVIGPPAFSGAGSRGASEVFGLTDREAEVILLVAAGWSNQQIADSLFITRKTASVHVSNILGKLGVQNRGEAAALAHSLGITLDTAPDRGGRSGGDVADRGSTRRPLVP